MLRERDLGVNDIEELGNYLYTKLDMSVMEAFGVA